MNNVLIVFGTFLGSLYSLNSIVRAIKDADVPAPHIILSSIGWALLAWGLCLK